MKVWGLAPGSFRRQGSWSWVEGMACRKDTGEAVKRSSACTGFTCVGLSFLTCNTGTVSAPLQQQGKVEGSQLSEDSRQ